MKKTSNTLVDQYLDELQRLTADLPPPHQQELIADVAAHIDSALNELGSASDEDIRQVLADVGDPYLIAEEARHADDPREDHRPVSALSVLALIVACLSLLLPIFGTLLAIMVVWAASRGPQHPRTRNLVRLAATVVAAVAVIHLAVFFAATPTSVDVEVESESRLVPR